MDSKQEILSAIRRAAVPKTELPPLEGPWITYPDKLQQFLQVVTSVGARPVVVPDAAAAHVDLQKFEP